MPMRKKETETQDRLVSAESGMPSGCVRKGGREKARERERICWKEKGRNAQIRKGQRASERAVDSVECRESSAESMMARESFSVRAWIGEQQRTALLSHAAQSSVTTACSLYARAC